MGQHDMTITREDANTGITFRAAVNAALQALASTNSGDQEPPVTFPGMLWADTLNDQLKMRNTANDGWNVLASLGSTITAFSWTLLGCSDAGEWLSGLGLFDWEAATAAAVLAGVSATTVVTPSVLVSDFPAKNLKPEKDGTTVSKLWIYTKSGGALPDAGNVIRVAIPDGNGYTWRTRAAEYLSGNGFILFNDQTSPGYWGLATGARTAAYLHAIWDGTGIVWALCRSPRYKVSTTTTVTDNDFMLLEFSTTYTRSADHYCVPVARIPFEYDTGDSPDYTIITDAIHPLLVNHGLPPIDGGIHGQQLFTSSGTFTVPEGVELVYVTVSGGGGGGGGGGWGNSSESASGGGGGGGGAAGFCKRLPLSVIPGSSHTVTIGAGGGGGAGGTSMSGGGYAGSAGGTTSFGSLVACNGGSPGAGGGNGTTPNTAGAGGAGGAGGEYHNRGGGGTDGTAGMNTSPYTVGSAGYGSDCPMPSTYGDGGNGGAGGALGSNGNAGSNGGAGYLLAEW